MLKHQIIIDITPESAKKFASLSPEKQEQLKLLLSLKLQDLISPKFTKNSAISNSIQNAQNRFLTEEMLDCISEGNLENKPTNEFSEKIIEKIPKIGYC